MLKLWRSHAAGAQVANEEWQPFITISFDIGPSVLPILCQLTRKLHLPELQTLSFFCNIKQTHSHIEAMGNTMVELLARFAGAQHLIVNMRSVAVLGRAMSTTNSDPPYGTGPGDDTGIPCLFRKLTTLSLFETRRCFGDLKAQEMLQSLSEADLSENFKRSLAVLRDQGRLQGLNVSWQELDDWTPLFEGVVRVQALPAAMERYMDMEVVVRHPVTHYKILGYESEVLSD